MDELKALAKLINDSVEQIEGSCKARNVIFPSLSEKFTPESEAARADSVMLQATGNITAAASQLISLARPAPLTILTKSIQVRVSHFCCLLGGSDVLGLFSSTFRLRSDLSLRLRS